MEEDKIKHKRELNIKVCANPKRYLTILNLINYKLRHLTNKHIVITVNF